MTDYRGRWQRRKPNRALLIICGAALAAIALVASVYNPQTPSAAEPPTLMSAEVPVPVLPVAHSLHVGDSIDEPPGPSPQSQARTWGGTVGSSDTFYGLLTGHGIDPAAVLTMARQSKKTFDLTDIRSGQPYSLLYERDSGVIEFRYRMDSDHDYVARLDADRFRDEVAAVPWDIRLRHLSGTINDSIFESLRSRGVGDAIPMKLAVIYAWDIEFAVDIRPGDTYNILFQEKWRNGQFVEYGKVLAATLHNRGEDHTAIYFKDGSGFEDYYDPEGQSMRKQFLRSPVNYTRISSGFNRRRFHPILKQVRPHLGVDLAAPYGTPIRSVGDGRVLVARRKGGSGNMVKIRHGTRYMTAYLHLSRFAKGVREGRTVTQGQVIGYVGSTGLATGPHVCYRFYVDGRYVNPLAVKFPSAEPVKEGYRQEFFSLASGYRERLATAEVANDDPSPSG